MAGKIALRVVTPIRLVLEEEVDELTAPGPLGQLGILPDHAALMTTLDIGQLSYKQAGSTRVLAVNGGYAEVLDNVVTILANAAEFPNEIDVARAEEARDRAERILLQIHHHSEEDVAQARASLRRALVRLETAGRR